MASTANAKVHVEDTYDAYIAADETDDMPPLLSDEHDHAYQDFMSSLLFWACLRFVQNGPIANGL